MTDPLPSPPPHLGASESAVRPSELRLTGLDAPSHGELTTAALATPSDDALTQLTPGPADPYGLKLEGAACSSFPEPPATFASRDLDTPTPSKEYQRHLSLPSVFSSVLPSNTQQTSMAAAWAAKQGLRLPSFESLGIAAPHPDRMSFASNQDLIIGAGPSSKPSDPLHLQSPFEATLGIQDVELFSHAKPLLPSAESAHGSITHYVSTLTPPDEAARSRWPDGFPNVISAAMESPAQSDPERTTPSITQADADRTTSGLQLPARTTSDTESTDSALGGQWLDPAMQVLLSSMSFGLPAGNALRVLSHALPTPSANGHIFPTIINRILDRMTPHPAIWVNVFHAVPGRFNLQDLPTSPPNTPGSAVGGDDYFTSKTFDTAVPVADYEQPAAALTSSQRPIVPPGSINVSIIERYIPPPTPNEARSLFDRSGSSLLSDRLIELSADNGLLMFIYPTKTGARTFMSDYLGPILEPLVRSMTIINGLSADLGSSLHQMVSVEHLVDFGELRASMEQFCKHLSAGNGSLSRFHPERKTTYEVIYANREHVTPSREIWSADWWVKQEKPRIRATVSKYVRESKKQQDDLMPTTLIQELLDGVASKSNPNSKPSKGIEIGVFVIRKAG